MDAQLNHLPPDREALQAILRSLLVERDEQRLRAEQQRQRADELHLQNLRLPSRAQVSSPYSRINVSRLA